MAIVAPSLLASDFLNLEKECAMLNESEADWFHLDVMDGNFVPNISFGFPVIEQLRKKTAKPFDVHLMISAPERYIEDFRSAGADHLTIHYEGAVHLHRSIEKIKQLGMLAGVALNPHTPVFLLEDIIEQLDIVLVMSVNPGFGGQKFIERSLHKISALKQIITERNLKTKIEVDGGITLDNAESITKAGAGVLVVGSTVFHSGQPKETIARLKLA